MIEVIRVVIEVWDGATRSGVVARARSAREVASITAVMCPNAGIRVRFPINPRAFFVKVPTARAETVGFERPEGTAA